MKNSKKEKAIGYALVVLVAAYVIVPKSWFTNSTSELIAIALIVLLTTYMVYLIIRKEDSRN